MMWGGAFSPGLVRSQDFCAIEMMLNVKHCWRKKIIVFDTGKRSTHPMAL